MQLMRLHRTVLENGFFTKGASVRAELVWDSSIIEITRLSGPQIAHPPDRPLVSKANIYA